MYTKPTDYRFVKNIPNHVDWIVLMIQRNS